ncbi:MAG: T9SS type A sorting domain-containing protein [Flavobacteriales bacterium]
MRYTTLFALPLFLACPLLGQPTLLSNEMLPIGSVINMRIMQTFSAIDTMPQGANATWDFTGLSADLGAPQFIQQIVAPASTPNGATFPSSNYCWKELPNGYYRYFNLSSTKMERVGSYTTSAKIYSDPQIEYVFPLTMGTTNYDTWETATSDGTYALTCVGYGTLQLPGNTYDDVLMVRVNATELGFFEYVVYFWYSSENGATLVQYIPDGILTESGLFIESLGIGMDEHADIASLVSATTVDDQLLIRFNTTEPDVRYSIVTTSGTELMTGSLGGAAQQGEVRTVPVGGLAAGMYLLRLDTPSGRSAATALRFIKD